MTPGSPRFSHCELGKNMVWHEIKNRLKNKAYVFLLMMKN